MTDDNKNIQILYQENATFLRYTSDWRHNILLRYFVAIAAFALIAKWMLESNDQQLKGFLFVPPMFVTLSSLAFLLMERRNIRIIKMALNVGAKLEKVLYYDGGYFIETQNSRNLKKHFTVLSYGFILSFIYSFTAIVALIVSIILLFN